MTDHEKFQARIVHLQMLQSAVARMAGYSSSLKNYCMTLVAALVAFYANKPDGRIFIAIWAIILVFAWLDARYLRLERGFIRRFEIERAKPPEGPLADFSMSPHDEEEKEPSTLCVAASWSVLGFYGALLAMSAGLWLLFALTGAPAAPPKAP